MSKMSQNAEYRTTVSWQTARFDLSQWQELYLVFVGSALNGSLTVALAKLLIAAVVQYLRRAGRLEQSGNGEAADKSASCQARSSGALPKAVRFMTPALGCKTGAGS